MTLTIKAHTIGQSLKRARHTASILPDDAARLLKVSHAELVLFENGEIEIPKHILDSIFALGLTMMHTRSMMRDYNRMTRQWRQMHDKALELHNKLAKIKNIQSPVLEN